MTTDFNETVLHIRERVDTVLEGWLAPSDVSERLLSSMRYSVFNGGKRVRPVLAYAAASAISEPNLLTDRAAAAVECIHAYSLIHDDLPAMDDDDLRRGKPTCHIQFDEATAVLAGDALQALAFQKLSSCDDPYIGMLLVQQLADASGPNGMVGGQMLDIAAEGQQSISLEALERIHAHKTGALIRAAVRMGAISVGATDDQLAAFTRYADAIGLAFQVHDDIIDVCSDTETLGKQQGADVARGKSTYVSLLGLDAARNKASELILDAKKAINREDIDSRFLSQMADYIISRQH